MIRTGTAPQFTDPIGPEQRMPLTGTSLFHSGPVQIGWAYLNASGWPIRAEITDASWLDTSGMPFKSMRVPAFTPLSIGAQA